MHSNPLCPECGSEVAPGLLACPGCRRLVYAGELKRLAAEGERAEQAGDLPSALGAWREALGYLPTDSKQYEAIVQRIKILGGAPTSGASGKRPTALAKGAAGAGAIGLFLWKFKFALAFVLTKGKILLLGLTKLSTLLSMFAFFGVYWSVFGWRFAAGLVVSIYIHEMGHVAMLRRYGIKAEPPMFIPGLGALVRIKQYPVNPVEDARVGLAGPFWGLGAAVASFLLYLATGSPLWGAVAKFGAFINLFNMIPIWQLDGGRGFRSLTRAQRAVAALAVGTAWLLTEQSIFIFIALGAVYRVAVREPVEKGDNVGLFEYVFLIAGLAAMLALKLPDLPPA